VRVLLLLLLFPYALSISSAELQRGHSYSVVASAPEGSVVALGLPAGLSSDTPRYMGGDTWRATILVADDVPLSRTPVQIVLLVDGAPRASATVRIWTEDVRQFHTWLPMVLT
jgi:hypothetical protein